MIVLKEMRGNLVPHVNMNNTLYRYVKHSKILLLFIENNIEIPKLIKKASGEDITSVVRSSNIGKYIELMLNSHMNTCNNKTNYKNQLLIECQN